MLILRISSLYIIIYYFLRINLVLQSIFYDEKSKFIAILYILYAI